MACRIASMRGHSLTAPLEEAGAAWPGCRNQEGVLHAATMPTTATNKIPKGDAGGT